MRAVCRCSSSSSNKPPYSGGVFETYCAALIFETRNRFNVNRLGAADDELKMSLGKVVHALHLQIVSADVRMHHFSLFDTMHSVSVEC